MTDQRKSSPTRRGTTERPQATRGRPAKGTAKSAAGDERHVSERRRIFNLGPLAMHTGYLVRRAQLAIFNDLIAAFGDDNIRLAEYSVLMVLEANPGVSHGDVVAALGIKRTNFVGLFNRLEKRGLVERRTVPTDGRANALFLSPAGAKLLARLTHIAGEHEARIRSLIGEAGQQQLQNLLPELSKLGDAKLSD